MTLMNLWLSFKGMMNNKKGQGMVEYILIIALIAIVVIAALSPLGGAIVDKFNAVKDTLAPAAQ